MKLTINLESVFLCLVKDIRLDPLTVKYCIQRFRTEGVKFFTVTLPKLSASVLRSLELGTFDRPTDFAWKGRSLRYFRSLLNRIFCPVSGTLLKGPDVANAIRDVRQLCDYLYKLAFSFDEGVLEAAVKEYVKVDSNLPKDITADSKTVQCLRKNFETYYAELSRAHTADILSCGVRFGPGSFAGSNTTRVPYYTHKVKSDDVIGTTTERFRAFCGYFRPYPACPEPIKVLKKDTSDYSELLFVAKDSRGPRSISKEPLFLLKGQMAFFSFMSRTLEAITHRRINFESQDINRRMVLDASIDRAFSTLDLKSGSDRVSFSLCKEIFRYSPGLYQFITQFRSKEVLLPNGEIHTLNKLSGMGSGLTFPVMALLIHLVICTHVSRKYAVPYKDIMRCVYVYGDDTIVPSKYYNDAIDALESVGLLVNRTKSFTNSFFRESCGADFYEGSDVTPVRLKLSNASLSKPTSKIDLEDEGIIQLERHCRELVKNGLWNTSRYYYTALERCLGVLPNVTGDTPVIGRYVINPTLVKRADIYVKCFVPKSQKVSVEMCPYKFLSSRMKASAATNLELLFGSSTQNEYGTLDVPRKSRLRLRKVFDARLIGV